MNEEKLEMADRERERGREGEGEERQQKRTLWRCNGIVRENANKGDILNIF